MLGNQLNRWSIRIQSLFSILSQLPQTQGQNFGAMNESVPPSAHQLRNVWNWLACYQYINPVMPKGWEGGLSQRQELAVAVKALVWGDGDNKIGRNQEIYASPTVNHWWRKSNWQIRKAARKLLRLSFYLACRLSLHLVAIWISVVWGENEEGGRGGRGVTGNSRV